MVFGLLNIVVLGANIVNKTLFCKMWIYVLVVIF